MQHQSKKRSRNWCSVFFVSNETLFEFSLRLFVFEYRIQLGTSIKRQLDFNFCCCYENKNVCPFVAGSVLYLLAQSLTEFWRFIPGGLQHLGRDATLSTKRMTIRWEKRWWPIGTHKSYYHLNHRKSSRLLISWRMHCLSSIVKNIFSWATRYPIHVKMLSILLSDSTMTLMFPLLRLLSNRCLISVETIFVSIRFNGNDFESTTMNGILAGRWAFGTRSSSECKTLQRNARAK